MKPVNRKFLKSLFIFCTVLVTMACNAPAHSEEIMTGSMQINILLPLVKGKSVAVVANQTSLIRSTHLCDTLISLGVNVKKIFSPEHGFRGNAAAGYFINDTLDARTGTHIISLYGKHKKPQAHDLKNIDVVIYDIQDVGVRFYTYISTLHYVMESCAENNIPLIIPDRPNPLGYYIDGPVLDTSFRSFVGMHQIPIVYGMTVGELALMINGEGWLADNAKCDLTIIKCLNYDHNSYWKLPVSPSPNLNSMEAIYLYPSLCLLEGTIMSVGRGTEFPFRIIGHPDYPEKKFSFTPKPNNGNNKPMFMNKVCYGIDLRDISLEQLQKQKHINLEWIIQAYKTSVEKNKFFTDYFEKLAGNSELRKQIESGANEIDIRLTWQSKIDSFKKLRKKYLLYKDFE